MEPLAYVDRSKDPAAWAKQLGISREAVELYIASEVVDLHVDSFIWTRILGYDLRKRHGLGPLGGRFYSQVDFPRLLEARIGGAMWSITTSPFRSARGRARAFARNLAHLRGIFEAESERFAVVRTRSEYDAARASGRHAAMLAIQGGNAIDESPEALDAIVDDSIVRVTLVHLSSSSLGTTSSPLRFQRDHGLSNAAKRYIEALDARRIFVDLAHIHRRSFFEAVEVHDKALPLIVTHTGVSAVTRSWRNLDDEQLRAIANTGGTVGVIFNWPYVGRTAAGVVDHIEHIVNTVGEDHASIGTDFDGAIIPPRELSSCLEMPRLVDLMLGRGFTPQRIQKILGGNFLRTFRDLRP